MQQVSSIRRTWSKIEQQTPRQRGNKKKEKKKKKKNNNNNNNHNNSSSKKNAQDQDPGHQIFLQPHYLCSFSECQAEDFSQSTM